MTETVLSVLITQSLSDKDINRIESAKTLHDTRWLDVNDVKYQEIVVVLRKTISTYCESCETNGFNNDLKRLCIQELQKHNLLSGQKGAISIVQSRNTMP